MAKKKPKKFNSLEDYLIYYDTHPTADSFIEYINDDSCNLSVTYLFIDKYNWLVEHDWPNPPDIDKCIEDNITFFELLKTNKIHITDYIKFVDAADEASNEENEECDLFIANKLGILRKEFIKINCSILKAKKFFDDKLGNKPKPIKLITKKSKEPVKALPTRFELLID